MLSNKLEYYKNLQYNVIIEIQEFESETWYIAYTKELGKYACYGRGDDQHEALESFFTEKDIFIEHLYNLGKPIPEPSKNENDNYSGVFNVRTSSSIHSQLVGQAKELGISLNLYLNQILSAAAEKRKMELAVIEKINELSLKIDNHHFEITNQMRYQNDKLTKKLSWQPDFSENSYLQIA